MRFKRSKYTASSAGINRVYRITSYSYEVIRRKTVNKCFCWWWWEMCPDADITLKASCADCNLIQVLVMWVVTLFSLDKSHDICLHKYELGLYNSIIFNWHIFQTTQQYDDNYFNGRSRIYSMGNAFKIKNNNFVEIKVRLFKPDIRFIVPWQTLIAHWSQRTFRRTCFYR